MAKTTAVLTAVVDFWAQLWIRKATAVARIPVKATAFQTVGFSSEKLGISSRVSAANNDNRKTVPISTVVSASAESCEAQRALKMI